MFLVILVSLVSIASILISFLCNDDKRGMRAIANILLILLAVIASCGYWSAQGVFGIPNFLDNSTYYHVLSATPIDEKSTVVILRGATGKTVPIEFQTQLKVDTNKVYTIVGNDENSYNLVPIK